MIQIECSTKVWGPWPPVLKRCSACGESLPLYKFCVDAQKRDCCSVRCKDCQNSRNRELRQQNLERYTAYDHKWKSENAEKVKVEAAHYRSKKSKQLAEHKRAVRRANPELARAKDNEWRRANPDKVRAAGQRRRARVMNAPGSYTDADIEDIRKAQGNRCYICHKKLGPDFHVDHFIPLSKGGTNDPGNLRLACPFCNKSKNSRHPHELGLLI